MSIAPKSTAFLHTSNKHTHTMPFSTESKNILEGKLSKVWLLGVHRDAMFFPNWYVESM